MRLFDNVFVRFFFFFLPFSYALTFSLGFPLKISEVALLFLAFIIAFKGKFKMPITGDRTFQVFTMFLGVALISLIINLSWDYTYKLNLNATRFGNKIDSILKFFYLLLAFATFLFASNVFRVNRQRYINLFLYGGVVAGIYSWYLFASGLFHITPILLPGMKNPQYITLSLGTFIRSGTFLEGNFMGLFLLFCIVLSFYVHKEKLAYFFIFTLFTTFSSIGFVCTFFFLGCYYFKKNYTKRRVILLLSIFLLMIFSILMMMGNEDFNSLILSKFSVNKAEISNSGEYSKIDRMNLLIVGLRMGIENPIAGVGISNYALHYYYFNRDDRFPDNDFKRIPNNVYIEVFAELGIVCLGLFLYILYLLYKKTQYDDSRILRFGFVAALIYFFAFPTFSVLYIWVFFGLIASLQKNKISNTEIADVAMID